MAHDKRLPTFADRLINTYSHDHALYPMRLNDALRSKLRTARRYALDDSAVRQVGEVCRKIPDLLVREQQFARPLHDLMFIEYDTRLLWRTINPDLPELLPNDSQLGLLLDHNTVYTFVGMPQIGVSIQLLPWTIGLHQTWELQDEIAFCEDVGVSRGQLDTVMWGSVLVDIPEEQRRALRAHHSMQLLPFSPQWQQLKGSRKLANVLLNSAGDVRNLITILLLLNRPSLTLFKEVPHWRTFVRGKSRVYLAHNVVSINLDPVPTLQLVGTIGGEAIARRRHEVRATWCHDAVYRRAKGCIHEWQPHPDFMASEQHLYQDGDVVDWRNWQCTLCGGHRWRRELHERGDASLGYVVKRYNVTA